jgi:uncharacterized membrane protein
MRIPALVVLILVIAACNNSAGKKEDLPAGEAGTIDTNQTAKQMPGKSAGPDTVFTGFGNEPFWAIYVIDREKIVFHPADGPDLSVPLNSDFYPDSIKYSYGGSVGVTTIVLTVTKKDCSDGMSDETHPYEVSVFANKTKYAGCGRLGTR